MAVTPGDIATELGKVDPAEDSVTWRQWSRWIDRAYRQIRRRADAYGVEYDSLDWETVDDVVTFAVVRRQSRPTDGAESISDQVSVDDGSVNQTRRYGTGMGDLQFLDEWWEMLGLSAVAVGGFSGSLPYSRSY